MRLTRFYFMANPRRSVGFSNMSNPLTIEIDGESFEVYNSESIRTPFRQKWLTDEICDRIGKQLASDRTHWTQFVDA